MDNDEVCVQAFAYLTSEKFDGLRENSRYP